MDANQEMIIGGLFAAWIVGMIYIGIKTLLKSKEEDWERTHDE